MKVKELIVSLTHQDQEADVEIHPDFKGGAIKSVIAQHNSKKVILGGVWKE